MTRIQELKKTRDRISDARDRITSALAGAVLSSHRHRKLRAIESELLEFVGELEDELERRGEPSESAA